MKKNRNKNSENLNILYFFMKSKMTENQDALLRETPLILTVKRVNSQIEDYLRTILQDLFYSRDFVYSRMAEKARSHV